MKKYILFTMETYYPSGGVGDIGGDFDTLEEATKPENMVTGKGQTWEGRADEAYVVDRDTWEVVWEWRHNEL